MALGRSLIITLPFFTFFCSWMTKQILTGQLVFALGCLVSFQVFVAVSGFFVVRVKQTNYVFLLVDFCYFSELIYKQEINVTACIKYLHDFSFS